MSLNVKMCNIMYKYDDKCMNVSNNVVLCWIMLHCVGLCQIMLCCVILCCTMLDNVVLCCVMLCCV